MLSNQLNSKQKKNILEKIIYFKIYKTKKEKKLKI